MTTMTARPALDPELQGLLSSMPEASPLNEETLEMIARAKRGRVRDLMVVMLDRPRHEEMVGRIRAAGARIRFISHGDVAGSIMAASPDTGIDLLWGIGGTPEGVL